MFFFSGIFWNSEISGLNSCEKISNVISRSSCKHTSITTVFIWFFFDFYFLAADKPIHKTIRATLRAADRGPCPMHWKTEKATRVGAIRTGERGAVASARGILFKRDRVTVWVRRPLSEQHAKTTSATPNPAMHY